MRLFAAFLCLASSAYSSITVNPSTLGNLFLTTETVSIPYTSSTPATWTVTNYWGAVVASGSGSPIAPGITKVGWYEVAIKEGTAAPFTTTFGIVTPLDARVMQDVTFGAATHFAQSTDLTIIPLMARLGLGQAGDDHYWDQTERVKGSYVFPARWESYMAGFKANGLWSGVGLGWSNPLYVPAGSHQFTMPYDDAQRQGYANYAMAILGHYTNPVLGVGVWNEVNAGTFVQGPAAADKVGYYHLMLKKLYETIKPVYPNVLVCAFNTVPIAHGFLRDAFAYGSLAYCDAVGIHPYRTYPDGVALEINILRQMMVSAGGGAKGIWAGEFGFATPDPRREAASYLAQMITLMRSENVERISWFQLLDDSNFPTWGIVGSSPNSKGKFRPHPSAIAYANLIRQLAGATPNGRHATPASIYAMKFNTAVQPLTVLWSNRPVQVDLTTSGSLTVVNIMGEQAPEAPPAAKVRLSLTKDALYVYGNISAVTPVGNDLLADSVSGFSKTQGTNGWTYGSAPVTPTSVYSPAAFVPSAWATWGGDNYRWIKSGGLYPFDNAGVGMHPSGGTGAVRRWTSNYAGHAKLSGTLARGASGDGSGVRIFVDGAEVYNVHILPNQTINYVVPDVTLQVGSKVDFTLNSWSDGSFDATTFTSEIIGTTPQAPIALRIVSQ